MSGPNDVTPRLREWIKEPVSLPEDGIAQVARLVHDTPQQRGPLPPLRALHIPLASPTVRLAAAAVTTALVGALVVTLAGMPDVIRAPRLLPATQPDWPNVTFEPVAGACAAGCDWVSGGVWEVKATHRGDFGSTGAIAFGPSGPPWLLSDDTIWQLGLPGESTLSAATVGDDQVRDLVVADDGRVWVAGDLGLHSFDGETWTEHWTEAPLVDVTLAPDGSLLAVGGGRVSGLEDAEAQPIVVVHLDEDGIVARSPELLPEAVWPTTVASTSDGHLWISVVESGYVPTTEGESLIAHFDGEDWAAAWPLGPEVDVAAWSLVSGPDGSLWASLWAAPDDGGFDSYLAHFEGQDWTLYPTAGQGSPALGLVAGLLLRVDAEGTVWFVPAGVDGSGRGGLVAFDGDEWTRYLAGEDISAMEIGPDGTVWATTIAGFDEEGQLFAIRR